MTYRTPPRDWKPTPLTVHDITAEDVFRRLENLIDVHPTKSPPAIYVSREARRCLFSACRRVGAMPDHANGRTCYMGIPLVMTTNRGSIAYIIG